MQFTRELGTMQSPESVYEYLSDAARFGRLFPHCERVELHQPTGFTVSIAVGTSQFQGSLDLHMECPEAIIPRFIRYTGRGEAAANQITMDIAFDIAANGDGSHVICYCRADVNGFISFFGSDVADSLGRKKLDELVENLRMELARPERGGASSHTSV